MKTFIHNSLYRILIFSSIILISNNIYSAQITITSPNGGEKWTAGSTQNITWTTTFSYGSAMITYSTDSGQTWNTVVSSISITAGTYAWTVPTLSSHTCLIQVNAGNSYDKSDNVFWIDTVSAGGGSGTGFKTEKYNENLVVYPNPANKVINISTSPCCLLSEVNIYNCLGSLIIKKQYDDAQSSGAYIEIEHLPKGYYIIEARNTNKSIYTSKFLKLD